MKPESVTPQPSGKFHLDRSGVPFALAGIGAIILLVCLAGTFQGWQRTAGIGVGAALLAAGLVLRSTEPGQLAQDAAVFGLLTAPYFTFIMARAVRLDFWSGEIAALKGCLLSPLSSVFSANPSACGPVAASLLGNLALRLTGNNSLYGLLQDPFPARVLGLAWAAAALAVVYLAGVKASGSRAGFLAVIALSTAIPFYNFSTGPGSPSFAMLLAALLLYAWFSFEKAPSWRGVAAAGVLAALLCWGAPANFYFVLAAVVYALMAAFTLNTGRPLRLLKEIPQAVWGVALLGGGALGSLLTLAGQGVLSGAPAYLDGQVLASLLPTVLDNFISTRFLMVVAAAAGWFAAARAARNGENASLLEGSGFLAVLLVAPFLFVFIYYPSIPAAAFLPLLPAFALLVALGLEAFVGWLPRKWRRDWLVLVAVGVYACSTLYAEVSRVEIGIRADLETGHVSNGLYANYYQAAYHPAETLSQYRAANPTGALQVYLPGDDAALAYMDWLGIPRSNLQDAAGLRLGFSGAADVFTASTARLLQETAALYPGLTCARLDPAPVFQVVLRCSCQPGRGEGCPPAAP